MKHIMFAAPRRKKVEALQLISNDQTSGIFNAYMLAVGVTSESVTKIRAVATIPPPPKHARMDSSQMAFKGKMWGKEPGSQLAIGLPERSLQIPTNDILPSRPTLHGKNVHDEQPLPTVLVRKHTKWHGQEQAWQMTPESSPPS